MPTTTTRVRSLGTPIVHAGAFRWATETGAAEEQDADAEHRHGKDGPGLSLFSMFTECRFVGRTSRPIKRKTKGANGDEKNVHLTATDDNNGNGGDRDDEYDNTIVIIIVVVWRGDVSRNIIVVVIIDNKPCRGTIDGRGDSSTANDNKREHHSNVANANFQLLFTNSKLLPAPCCNNNKQL